MSRSVNHQAKPKWADRPRMIFDTPLKFYTARHIEVVDSWMGFPSWTPVHYEDR